MLERTIFLLPGGEGEPGELAQLKDVAQEGEPCWARGQTASAMKGTKHPDDVTKDEEDSRGAPTRHRQHVLQQDRRNHNVGPRRSLRCCWMNGTAGGREDPVLSRATMITYGYK
jgi:hypothetical protein